MPKPKTKTGPLETVCTEVAPGCWEFTIGTVQKSALNQTRVPRYVWRYDVGMGINLSVADGREPEADRKFTRVLRAKNLDGAVYYAWGYDALGRRWTCGDHWLVRIGDYGVLGV